MQSGAHSVPITAYTTSPIVPTTAASQATAVMRLRIDAAIAPGEKAAGGSATVMRTAGFDTAAASDGAAVPAFAAATGATASSGGGGSFGSGKRSRNSRVVASMSSPTAFAYAR